MKLPNKLDILFETLFVAYNSIQSAYFFHLALALAFSFNYKFLYTKFVSYFLLLSCKYSSQYFHFFFTFILFFQIFVLFQKIIAWGPIKRVLRSFFQAFSFFLTNFLFVVRCSLYSLLSFLTRILWIFVIFFLKHLLLLLFMLLSYCSCSCCSYFFFFCSKSVKLLTYVIVC